MSSGVSFNAAGLYRPASVKTYSDQQGLESLNTQNYGTSSPISQSNGEQLLFNSLLAKASQNGFDATSVSGVSSQNAQNTSEVADMLKAGKKQEVKDKMGAQAVPALMAIVQDTSQPMQVRVDAIATLAKLVDEGKAPASCLVQLLKNPDCKDMAERAMANVGKEIMPTVKQLLKSSDPQMKESAKNILNDMEDAWAGYENDEKWGQECRELLPEVKELLAEVEKNENKDGGKTTSSDDGSDTADSDDANKMAGYTRQHVSFSNMMA